MRGESLEVGVGGYELLGFELLGYELLGYELASSSNHPAAHCSPECHAFALDATSSPAFQI